MLGDASFPSHSRPTCNAGFSVEAAEVGVVLVRGFFSSSGHVDVDLDCFRVGSNLLPDDGFCNLVVLLDGGLAVGGDSRLVPFNPQ